MEVHWQGFYWALQEQIWMAADNYEGYRLNFIDLYVEHCVGVMIVKPVQKSTSTP